MSRPLNPCNCEQAKCYEALLRELVERSLAYCNPEESFLAIASKAQKALDAYAQATEEYEQEG
jgi:hypothetical protein